MRGWMLSQLRQLVSCVPKVLVPYWLFQLQKSPSGDVWHVIEDYVMRLAAKMSIINTEWTRNHRVNNNDERKSEWMNERTNERMNGWPINVYIDWLIGSVTGGWSEGMGALVICGACMSCNWKCECWRHLPLAWRVMMLPWSSQWGNPAGPNFCVLFEEPDCCWASAWIGLIFLGTRPGNCCYYQCHCFVRHHNPGLLVSEGG